ncbi:hypothetical protein D2908_05655 [Streptococcus sp. LQJ-218]|nr:hypothetical protein D2908_05655 [Streptococcus sp. LQJ-218]
MLFKVAVFSCRFVKLPAGQNFPVLTANVKITWWLRPQTLNINLNYKKYNKYFLIKLSQKKEPYWTLTN